MVLKRCIFILLVFNGLIFNAQTKKIESLVSKLSNTQFHINHSSKATFLHDNYPAHKLIKIGKPATLKLIEALNDSAKIIMAQLVLSHIYFNKISFAGPKEKMKGEETIYQYFLGKENGEGLIINELKHNGSYHLYVEPKDVKDIIDYWKKQSINK